MRSWIKWIFLGTVVLIIVFVLANKEITVKKQEDTEKITTEKKIEDNILYEPERRISIALPFSAEDEPIGMNPMGETILHPVAGHPGIDFGWKHNAPIRACADGVVTAIGYNPEMPDTGDYLVKIISGQYYILAGGLESVAEGIKEGSRVKTGDIIGYPGAKKDSNYSIHWEMGPNYLYAQRLCPITYFDYSSRIRIEKIWDQSTTWEYRSQFPNICNGIWADLNSFQDIINWNNNPAKIEYDRRLDEYKSSNKQ